MNIVDILVIGVGLSMDAFAVSIIGLITFVCCFIGVKLGSVFGEKLKSKAEIMGGVMLILIGSKILIEHLFFQG